MYESIRGCFFIFVNATGSFELCVEHSAPLLTSKHIRFSSSILALLQILRVVILVWGRVGVRERERETVCSWGAGGWCSVFSDVKCHMQTLSEGFPLD